MNFPKAFLEDMINPMIFCCCLKYIKSFEMEKVACVRVHLVS